MLQISEDDRGTRWASKVGHIAGSAIHRQGKIG